MIHSEQNASISGTKKKKSTAELHIENVPEGLTGK
jgi:hypothetical protein